MKKGHVKEVGFSGRGALEPGKENIECWWGQARGHSCQMRPERDTWLLSKESGFGERVKAWAGLRWLRIAQNGEKDSWVGTRRVPQALKGSPAAKKGHCSMTHQPQALDQTCSQEVAVLLSQLALDSTIHGARVYRLTPTLQMRGSRKHDAGGTAFGKTPGVRRTLS